MSEAKDPTVRMSPRLREIIPGTTSFVTLSVALLFLQAVSVSHRTTESRHDRARNAHVDLDNVNHVLVRQVLEVHRLVVALADIVDFSHAGARPRSISRSGKVHSGRNGANSLSTPTSSLSRTVLSWA